MERVATPSKNTTNLNKKNNVTSIKYEVLTL